MFGKSCNSLNILRMHCFHVGCQEIRERFSFARPVPLHGLYCAYCVICSQIISTAIYCITQSCICTTAGWSGRREMYKLVTSTPHPMDYVFFSKITFITFSEWRQDNRGRGSIPVSQLFAWNPSSLSLNRQEISAAGLGKLGV